MLINLTNHPSSKWSTMQKNAASIYGEIVDYPFPQVDPQADEAAISLQAETITADLAELHPNAVLCQGEMTLAFALVSRLKQIGIPVLAACSTRCSRETVTETGSTVRTSEYVFCRFREYE